MVILWGFIDENNAQRYLSDVKYYNIIIIFKHFISKYIDCVCDRFPNVLPCLNT